MIVPRRAVKPSVNKLAVQTPNWSRAIPTAASVDRDWPTPFEAARAQLEAAITAPTIATAIAARSEMVGLGIEIFSSGSFTELSPVIRFERFEGVGIVAQAGVCQDGIGVSRVSGPTELLRGQIYRLVIVFCVICRFTIDF
jgi:hypothetical protein